MEGYPYKNVIELTLAFPSIGAPINFEVEDDVNSKIIKAVDVFNCRFENRKEIKLLSTKGRCIKLELLTSFQPENATKEISVFSQILVNDFRFSKYSSKPGRLFKSEVIGLPKYQGLQLDESTPYSYDADSNMKDFIIKETSTPYNATKTFMQDFQLEHKGSIFVEMSNEILATNNVDKLDNYIKQLENLLSLTKSKKDIIVRSE